MNPMFNSELIANWKWNKVENYSPEPNSANQTVVGPSPNQICNLSSRTPTPPNFGKMELNGEWVFVVKDLWLELCG